LFKGGGEYRRRLKRAAQQLVLRLIMYIQDLPKSISGSPLRVPLIRPMCTPAPRYHPNRPTAPDRLHANKWRNLLTWYQALSLDFHFAIEQRARGFLRTFYGGRGGADGARLIGFLFGFNL